MDEIRVQPEDEAEDDGGGGGRGPEEDAVVTVPDETRLVASDDDGGGEPRRAAVHVYKKRWYILAVFSILGIYQVGEVDVHGVTTESSLIKVGVYVFSRVIRAWFGIASAPSRPRCWPPTAPSGPPPPWPSWATGETSCTSSRSCPCCGTSRKRVRLRRCAGLCGPQPASNLSCAGLRASMVLTGGLMALGTFLRCLPFKLEAFTW